MSYISDNLKPDEKVIFETKLHWLIIVINALWSWMLFFIPLIFILLRYFTTEFVVTNRRIVIKHGILSRNIKEAPLDKIQNISLRQGLFGRLFDFGTVTIHTAAEFGQNTFPYVQNPIKLRKYVWEQIDLYKEEQIKKQAEMLAKEMGKKPDNV